VWAAHFSAAYSSLYRGGPGSGGAVLVRCTIPHDVGWGVEGCGRPGVCAEAVGRVTVVRTGPFRGNC
jgi:hypothetical protein